MSISSFISPTNGNAISQDNLMITDENETKSSRKRKLPDYFQKPKIKGRKILKLNESASIKHEKRKVELTSDNVKQYAFLRMQIFPVSCFALWTTAANSKENVENLDVRCGRARLQGAQGSFGRHGSHAHTTAGLTDNEIEDLYERTVEDGLTPTKKPIFQALGVTLEELEEMANNLEEDLVNSVFEKIIQRNKDRVYSMIGGTDLEKRMNVVAEMPSDLNLIVDGGLEKAIRPDVVKIYRAVMLAQITPEKATKEYHRLIHRHWTKTIPLLRKRIRQINTLSKLIETNASKNSLSIQTANKINCLIKELKISYPGVPIPKLSLTYRFITGLKKGKVVKTKNNKTITVKWIKHEQNVQIKRLQRIFNYTRWEQSGTELPDYTLLVGQYNPRTQKREPLSISDKLNLSVNLIKNPDVPPITLTPNSLESRKNLVEKASGSSSCRRRLLF